jgi:hypothetical protein
VNMDLELAAWRTDWQAPQASDAAMLRLDLRRLVEQERRKMGRALFGELLFGAVMLAGSAWFASTRPTLEWILWAAVIWAGTFFAAGFAVWNKGGTWKAMSQSNAAFLDLSRQRCLRELRALRIGRWFLAVQLVIVAGWLSWDYTIRRLPMRPYFFAGGVTILLAAAYLEWFAARERRSLRALGRLDQFEDQPEP